MSNAPAAAPPRSSKRRWHLPPPLIHGSEPLEGGEILEEVPGELGLLLWQALRDVLLWSETPAGQRSSLFRSTATPVDPLRQGSLLHLTEATPEAGAALASLLELARSPRHLDTAVTSANCAAIAAWAEASGYPSTALSFAQAAAVALPTDPELALAVGQVAARNGDIARAELWLRRTIGLARRARAWRPYSCAFSALGRLAQDRGNLPAAHRLHLRALRGARRGGMRAEQALALHDLFAVAVEAGRPAHAERFARQALSTYSKRNPRLVLLAHDIAYFWMEAGHFGQALALFESVAPLVTDPVEQLWVHANLMRAAAGARQSDRADQAAQLVRRWCLDAALQAGVARAQLELARGELQLGRWEAAQTAAEQALRAARDRREGRTTLSAEALLEAITAARAAGRPAPTPVVPPADSPDRTLTEALLASLRELPEGLTAAESAPETAAGVSVPRGSSSP